MEQPTEITGNVHYATINLPVTIRWNSRTGDWRNSIDYSDAIALVAELVDTDARTVWAGLRTMLLADLQPECDNARMTFAKYAPEDAEQVTL